MKIANFIEYNYESKINIIKEANLDEEKFKDLKKRKILKKSDSGEYYCFQYVGAIFTPKSIIYVSPKVLTKEKIDKDFNEKLIKLFMAYSKRETLLLKEKEFLGTQIKDGKGSLLSIIDFIMEDYIENGLYIKKRKVIEVNGIGQIDWNKTINRNRVLINYNNEPVYYELATIKKNIHSDLLITQIHKKIINTCNEILRKLSLYDVLKYEVEYFEIDDYDLRDNEFLLENLQRELDLQYEDKKIELLEILIAFLKKYQKHGNDIELTLFGTRNFEIVWEKMNSYIFRNQYDYFSSFIPKPKWFSNNSEIAEERKTLIPDILYLDEEERIFYILDAKYYTTDFQNNKLSGTVQGIEDIVKQLVYEDVLSQKYFNYNFINAFIIPTTKESIKIGRVEFPISKTGQVIQIIHMNIYEVIEMYLKNKRLDIREWSSNTRVDKFVEVKDVIVNNYEYKDVQHQSVNENIDKYDYNNVKFNICSKLLIKKFGEERIKEQLIKMRDLEEDILDTIIDNIFDVKNLNDLMRLMM